MTKKHQTSSINATYQRTSLKQLLKKIFEPTKGNPNIIEENVRNESAKQSAPSARVPECPSAIRMPEWPSAQVSWVLECLSALRVPKFLECPSALSARVPKCPSGAEVSKCRSSHQRCSIKKSVLRNFTKFIGKHLCQSLFFNKVAGLKFYHILLGTCNH